MKPRYKIAINLALAVVVLDQLTKLLIQNFPPFEGKTIIPGFFNLVYVLNKGAAFGFLNRADMNWQTYFFIGVTVLAMVLIFRLLHTIEREDKILFCGLGFILGGAVGNLIDRIRIGHVIDFLDFYIGSTHWPAFNVADSAISVGGFCLLITFFRNRDHGSNPF